MHTHTHLKLGKLAYYIDINCVYKTFCIQILDAVFFSKDLRVICYLSLHLTLDLILYETICK